MSGRPGARRASRADGLRLASALPERMLPALVGGMAFLAALALAGAIGARRLADRWSAGAGALLTIQVPDASAAASSPERASRIDTVMARLARTPGLADPHVLPPAELRRLLQPWLATPAGDASLPLPAVVQLRVAAAAGPPTDLAGTLDALAPGTLVEDGAPWSRRLLALATSLQACAGLALLTVTLVAGCVVALATRAGVLMRRQAIEVLHGLGASDGDIAGRFARRAGRLALIGGAGGAVLALPLLGGLWRLATPFTSADATSDRPPDDASGESGFDPASLLPTHLPLALLLALPALPLAACLIGWLTAQGTVRLWLRRLP